MTQDYSFNLMGLIKAMLLTGMVLGILLMLIMRPLWFHVLAPILHWLTGA